MEVEKKHKRPSSLSAVNLTSWRGKTIGISPRTIARLSLSQRLSRSVTPNAPRRTPTCLDEIAGAESMDDVKDRDAISTAS